MSDPNPVLSAEQLRNLRLIFPSLALDEAAIRAVERAVLEAVGAQPNCEMADIVRRWGEITVENFFRDYPEIARELQRLTNIAVDLKDAYNEATALRARVAELERELVATKTHPDVLAYWDAIAERDTARRELSKVYEALHELFVWVQNWPPDFTDDDDWPDTEAKVRAALDRAREGE